MRTSSSTSRHKLLNRLALIAAQFRIRNYITRHRKHNFSSFQNGIDITNSYKPSIMNGIDTHMNKVQEDNGHLCDCVRHIWCQRKSKSISFFDSFCRHEAKSLLNWFEFSSNLLFCCCSQRIFFS